MDWLLVLGWMWGRWTSDMQCTNVPRWKQAKTRLITRISCSWWPSLSHDRHGAPILAPGHTTISQHAKQQVYFTIMCAKRQQWGWGCRQRCPQLRIGCLRQLQCNRFVLWTYWHCPVARFPWRRLGRQSKCGQCRGDLGRLTMVVLTLSTCALRALAKFG